MSPVYTQHERGRIGESSIGTDQGCHTLMDSTGNSVVHALMRPFVIVESEVTLQSGL